MSAIFRPRAKTDMIAIARYIADNNPGAALKWYQEIFDVCAILGELPASGHLRDDVRTGLRTFPKGNYVILYRTLGADAIILRVLHAARNWPKLMR